jgi:hypothetical protein
MNKQELGIKTVAGTAGFLDGSSLFPKKKRTWGYLQRDKLVRNIKPIRRLMHRHGQHHYARDEIVSTA